MSRIFKITTLLFIIGLFPSCSQVLETVNLELNSEDYSNQQNFNVVEKTLTIKEAQNQNNSSYKRSVLVPGRGDNAKTVAEDLIVKSNFPNKKKLSDYKIGVGDTLSFSRLIENNHSRTEAYSQWPENPESFNYNLGVGDNLVLTLLREEKTFSRIAPSDNARDQNLMLESQNDVVLETKGRIGSDGSVLLLEIGRLEAKGKTINELQSEVRNILIRNGASPRFQLEIVEFLSQRVYFTISEASRLIFLNDQKTTLRDILTASEVGVKPGVTSQVKLQRAGKQYKMQLRSVFSEKAPEVIIRDGDHIFVEDTLERITEDFSTVDDDGYVVFAGVGKIQAAGDSLKELKTKIASRLNRLPDSENAFQINLQGSASQKAIINIPGQNGGVVTIGTTPVTLAELLTENGLSINGDSITRIKLQRQGKSYIFNLNDLLNLTDQAIYIQPKDRITTEILSYKENKVFVLGGVTPKIYKINPTNRETLADILFTEGGVLSSSSAKRSEVYLLRGNNPVVAYHLDAQSPTRLIVANAMELRPNDILYVAEQPIISFNRTLGTILPLRILLRDIKDENIP